MVSATLTMAPETDAKSSTSKVFKLKTKGPVKTRQERKEEYMKRRWRSQQAAARRQRQQRKQQKPDGSVSAVGLDIGTIVVDKNADTHTTEGHTKSVQVQQKQSRKSTATKTASKKKTRPGHKGEATRRTRQWQSWETIEPAMNLSGIVTKVLPYGAVVQTSYNIPGNKTIGRALLYTGPPRNEDGKKEPSATLRPGQHLENLRVSTINRELGTVKLAFADAINTNRAPTIPVSALNVGDEIEGRVVRLKQYGAFVDIGSRRNALLHVSRMTLYKVASISDHVNVGDSVKVRILRLEADEEEDGDSGGKPRRIKNIAVSMLSPENDMFVDRRDLQRRRMELWQKVVQADEGDLSLGAYKKELLDLDRQIWDWLEESSGSPKSLEV